MKKILVLLMSASIAISSTIVSFAGEWKQDNVGWYYQNDDGGYVKNDWLTLGDEKYHFDSNGYMQSGLIEVNGIKHYFNNDGKMMYNGDTPEGYKIDVDGRVIDENTPGINFTVLWLSDPNKNTSSTVICDFTNEGKQEFTIDPIVEVNTDGVVKKFHMVDIKTLEPVDYGIVPANDNQDYYFAFASDYLQQFSFNDNTTVTFTVNCNSFVNSYYRIIPVKNLYRFHIEE